MAVGWIGSTTALPRRATPLASNRCRRFAPGRRASWACCWIFWTILQKTQPSCDDGLLHDPSSLWHSLAHRWIFLRQSPPVVRVRSVDSSANVTRRISPCKIALTKSFVPWKDWLSIFVIPTAQSICPARSRTTGHGPLKFSYLATVTFSVRSSSRSSAPCFAKILRTIISSHGTVQQLPPDARNRRKMSMPVDPERNQRKLEVIDPTTHAPTFTGERPCQTGKISLPSSRSAANGSQLPQFKC